MLDNRRLNPFIAVLGAAMLTFSAAPAVMAQPEEEPAAEAMADEAAEEAPAPAPVEETSSPVTMEDTMGGHGDLTPARMFMDADIVVKIVMSGLLIASFATWLIAIMKAFEFVGLGRVSSRFLEDFRSAKSISDAGKVARSEEYDGNPLADMAAAATHEVELSTQAGLTGEGHKEHTLERSHSAARGVQASLVKRMSGGMMFLASTGSTAPFIGLFGTVYGIMNSFIGIANTNTTNLAVVAPGIAEALLATGIGLFAAIPAVILYNIFQTQITGYGARTEAFASELMNFISRNLDKGA